MPLIDFVTLWFHKPRVVILHLSNDSCSSHGSYTCRWALGGKTHIDVKHLGTWGCVVQSLSEALISKF